MTKKRNISGGEFTVTDSSGIKHTILITIQQLLIESVEGDHWFDADRVYKTSQGRNVGHSNHEYFQLPDSQELLPKD